MRPPSLAWSWLKRTSLAEVAVMSRMGTLTSPKLIDPVQIGLGMRPFSLAQPVEATAAARSERYSNVGSPSRWRNERSRPAIGYRFWGARLSLWGRDAKRGNVHATVSARAM